METKEKKLKYKTQWLPRDNISVTKGEYNVEYTLKIKVENTIETNW